jgi:transposase-like protein
VTSSCPECKIKFSSSEKRPRIVRVGRFYRKSDSRFVQRFFCKSCERGFSRATHNPCYRQNKRQINEFVKRLLCSGVSLRRAARILGVNRLTIVRKLLFLSAQAEIETHAFNKSHPKVSILEFDDMETIEHTKCKPLSITLAVEYKTRRILAVEVSRMPAKGKLAHLSRKKYGPRPDQRPLARERLFSRIKEFVKPNALIKSDENPHYPNDVKRFFPECTHKAFKGVRGCVAGQGELKKIKFDPLFSLNHTCAKLRADINRLFRKTWCTTKRPDRLLAHLNMYIAFHNQSLLG